MRARHPGRIAAPGACGGQSLELIVNSFEALFWKAVYPVMKDSLHVGNKAYALGVAVDPGARARRIASSCHGGAWT